MPSLSRIVFTPDLTEQVYQRLLHAIRDGELAPETRLTQEELAAALGVSRQPVLQALWPSMTFRSLKSLPVTW